ncbi:MAG: thioesterase family protein [Microthrixaceae bacterium]|nr:thioesterase family protein [Microthrixaceae bacterium]
MTRLDMRLAKGRQWDELDGHPAADGRSAMWVRLPSDDGSPMATSAAALAILGDYVPFGIAQSQGTWWPSNSLDNTIRIVSLADTEWVLVDVRVEGVANGFGHGTVYLWSESGVPLAAASQSALLRRLPR